jgi:hypothetical protein
VVETKIFFKLNSLKRNELNKIFKFFGLSVKAFFFLKCN